MDSGGFTTSAHGKCILAGEHAVLSGCPAIVLPVREKRVNLLFSPHGEGCGENDLSTLFQQTLKSACSSLNKVYPKGNFTLTTNLEVGAGLGFSAALCVVITRWLIWKQWIKDNGLFDFARTLENHYHGKSSGVDIVGAMSEQMIHFESSIRYPLEAMWHPKLYLSYSGVRKCTKEAITQVAQLKKQNPAKADWIENNMKASVREIEEALKQDEHSGKRLFISGMQLARKCFEDWGLIPPKLQQHLNLLHQLGTLIAKPTGAGLGGYVISLWEEAPPPHKDIEWIEV